MRCHCYSSINGKKIKAECFTFTYWNGCPRLDLVGGYFGWRISRWLENNRRVEKNRIYSMEIEKRVELWYRTSYCNNEFLAIGKMTTLKKMEPNIREQRCATRLGGVLTTNENNVNISAQFFDVDDFLRFPLMSVREFVVSSRFQRNYYCAMAPIGCILAQQQQSGWSQPTVKWISVVKNSKMSSWDGSINVQQCVAL